MRRDEGRPTVISIVAFDEAPAVDVYDLAPLAAIAPEHVKTADHLSETVADARSPCLLFIA